MKIVLLADTDISRTKGLMFHKPLDIEECAFFEFPASGKPSFWNKNVDFPIALIFCDKDSKIKDIKKLNANQTECVSPSNYDIKYVIETHIDIPKKHNIKKDDIVIFDGKEVKFKKQD